ncbi:hypothetical protein Lal_00027399 [Lupinus albus]|uniref:Uncharacterized protein n=1 Tax=Lupinus albus TaxID=3870 RepID=A0A6A5MEK8_LUPAL|nr:hypothetical protein Lalb_Chr05g0214401 [Lupinus albus]KAF1873361.1 hypothetical protein Lal_00027399 [Lupinus albus]
MASLNIMWKDIPVLVVKAYLAYGIPQSSIRRLALSYKAAYNVGGHIISANAIEHNIFCFQTPRIGRRLESIMSAALKCEEM